MFLRITRTKLGKTVYRHAMIVESYRDGKTVRQRVLKNIGPVRTEEDIARAKTLLESMKTGGELVALDEIAFDRVREFGILYASLKLWERFGLKDAVEEAFQKKRTGFCAFDALFLLVTSRLYNPSSDLETYDWIRNKAHYPAADNLQLHHLYRTLDLLIEKKDELEKNIFEKLKAKAGLKVDIVFYDLTSTYFEGDGPDSAMYGYSRDKRRDRKQVVIGLVLCDGFPIMHKVWPGNTVDKSTLKEAVADLKQRFMIDRTIFVADRGLILETNLEELESSDYDYIIATRRRRDNFVKDLITLDIFNDCCDGDEKTAARVVKEDGKRRYILCFNRETQESEKSRLAKIKEESERKLEEIKAVVDGGRKRSLRGIDRLVWKTLKKSGARFFKWDFSDKVFSYSLKKDVWDYENAIAGRFLLVTNTDFGPEEAMKSYKDLKRIEQTFRELKDIINLRPVNHSSGVRVEGHVFVCVLSVLTRRLMSKSLLETNEIIRELADVKVVECDIGNERHQFLTRLSNKQEETFRKLGIELPAKCP